ncbi:nitrogenase iron-molybdenum cofactor biosynthesis protein NifN [Sulfurospirillum oryzae]|uniref:nitrogenase iron-molybdenum cofactor biosynthesis protein NifN n=1 Tax=Sulfurospirillum oryzae TaxID=2976535 RepID=UPI0021E6FE1E|nr:nitrogenase iron-molybdenum cofactor biosynthesis protein NifN [Sulfurospirillum oryzae]
MGAMINIKEFKNTTLKPLHVNPLKLSQPMGATLAFLGIKNCMPLMHGAQGCASFTKVLFTRHFNDPIAIQTTAVNDITAVIDGGEKGISEAVENITKKVTPDLVGLFTTGMTETKGDDIKGATLLLKEKQKMVYVHTPDFEGGLESGWSLSVQNIITQLIAPCARVRKDKALLIPNVNLSPIEVEKLKEALELLDFEVLALPDLSDSLDGHLGVKQGALSSGGISVAQIEALGDAGVVITVGRSVKKCGELFCEKYPQSTHLHFDSLMGLEASDDFYAKLLAYMGSKSVPSVVKRWRARLQDVLLDTHFSLGKAKIIIADEPDSAYALSKALREAGGTCEAYISQRSEVQEAFTCKVVIGDLEEVEKALSAADMLITNYHGERLAHKHHKALLIRGFPNYEQVGVALRHNILYEGSCAFLCETANLLGHH